MEDSKEKDNKGLNIYERRNGSDLLLCRNIEQANSPLWSRDLIETILAGSQTCVRLGTWEDKEKVFTAKFDEILDARKFSPRGQGIMPFSTFREVFNACWSSCIVGNLFAQLWKDLEQVTIGEVAKQYASLVFTPHAAAGVFTDAFWLAMRHGVSSENQMRFSWIAEKAEFTCKIDSPLSYFVREEHIAVMNMCMRFVHAAHRTLETLVTISTDRSLIDRLSCMPSRNSSECSLNSSAVSITEHNNAFSEDDFSLRKRLRFVVFILKQIVSHFKEFFINKARWVYRTTLNKILTATSVAQAEKASVEAHSLLHQLVEKANFRKRVHEAMSLYVNITDVIRLRLVSNTLTLKYVDECEQKVLKSVEMLLMLSKHYGHDKDTIFYLLASRIGFKSQIYSFDSRMS
ncbi:unnamed protein product [Caenorhabditis auriculariae]|uniref:Uncharacterized protein n=1 Tax=Caenorhabditis auriculariae TaxID=2777116 RepID=A0A8S1HWS9_9PELO|nr:unnamed protein product [Caenorhabditis auriculariae]